MERQSPAWASERGMEEEIIGNRWKELDGRGETWKQRLGPLRFPSHHIINKKK